jgi:hypothetical protein
MVYYCSSLIKNKTKKLMPIPTLSESIYERKLSYLKATLFLMDQEKIDNDRLRAWIQQKIQKLEQLEFSSVDEAEKDFDEFFKLLILEIAKETDISSDEAHKKLKEAEMLYVWDQKRATVVSEPIGWEREREIFSVKQEDRPITHTTRDQKLELLRTFLTPQPLWFQGLTPLTKKYLQHILLRFADTIPKLQGLADKQGTSLVNEYLKIFDPVRTPEWFRDLTPQQQEELRNHLNQMDQIIHTIPCYLRTIPMLANYGQHVVTVETPQGPVTTKRYRSAVVVPHDVITPNKSDIFPEQVRLTQQNIEQLFGDEQGEQASPLYQTAKGLIEQWGIQPNNPDQPIIIPVLIQTLISPTLFTQTENKIINVLTKAIRELGVLKIYTFEINGQIYYVQPTLTHSNYPLNAAKLLLATVPNALSDTRNRNLRNAAVLLQNAGTFLAQISHTSLPEGSLLQAFINALRDPNVSVLTFQFAQWAELIQEIAAITDNTLFKLNLKILIDALRDYTELYRTSQERTIPLPERTRLIFTSLEEIITERSGGLSSGSCRSGKDRKGMETIHTDAMLAHYLMENRFVRWDDEPETVERQNFAEIFAALFNSGQQQRWAATNAPGCAGFENLKITPTILSPIPSDLLDAIFKNQPEKLNQSNLLGHLFKPKNPLKEKEMALLELPSQFIFPRPLISTISKAVAELPAERPTTTEAPISLQLPRETKLKESLTATYFPEGSNTEYATNTVALSGGGVSDHIRNAAFCAIEYFKRNPDLDGLIELNGKPQVVETLQWIFVAAFGVPLSQIQIPERPSFRLIQVEETEQGLIKVPTQFQAAVNEAKKRIKERKREVADLKAKTTIQTSR